LTIHITTIFVDAEVVLFEALEATRSFVARFVTNLADWAVASATTTATRTRAFTTLTITSLLAVGNRCRCRLKKN
jgi:hypothetical protein